MLFFSGKLGELKCRIRPTEAIATHKTKDIIKSLAQLNEIQQEELGETLGCCFGIDDNGLLSYAIFGFVRKKHMKCLGVYTPPIKSPPKIDTAVVKRVLGVNSITFRFDEEDSKDLVGLLDSEATPGPLVRLEVQKPRKKPFNEDGLGFFISHELTINQSIEVADFANSIGNKWLLREATANATCTVLYRNADGWKAFVCGNTAFDGMEITDWYLDPTLSKKEKNKIMRGMVHYFADINIQLRESYKAALKRACSVNDKYKGLGDREPLVVCPEEFLEHYKLEKHFNVVSKTDNYNF